MSIVTVRVTPRASRNAIRGFDPAGQLLVSVAAPPADGAANVAVGRLLSDALGLPRRDVILVRGASSRLKQFEVPLTQAEIERRLGFPRT